MATSIVPLLSLGLTPGKLRGFQRISNANGTLTLVATDQNVSIISMLQDGLKKRGQDREPTYEEIIEAKVELARALGPHASGLLVDAYYGAWSTVGSLSMPRNTGLLIRVDRSVEGGNARNAPIGEIEPGWSVAKIKRCGADAVKLLAQFEPTKADSAERQFAFIREIYDECVKHDVLFLLGTVSFPFKQGDQMEDKQSSSYLNRKPATVVESARQLSRYCDVYQAEFPGTFGREPDDVLMENLHKLDEASERPWVLLSAGVDFLEFKKQVDMGMRAGASGVLGGRPLWKEYFTFGTAEERSKFATGEAVSRVRQVHEIVVEKGKPWFAHHGLTQKVIGNFRACEGWHFRYGEPCQATASRGHVPPGETC